MTKLITIFIIVVVCFCGYQLFKYWEQVRDEELQEQQITGLDLQPESLPGLPPQLNESLHAAQQRGGNALREWLRTFGPLVEDPRKAWIELDFCVAIARDDPAEARRVFASVKERTAPHSPVWPRVKQLEKSFK